MDFIFFFLFLLDVLHIALTWWQRVRSGRRAWNQKRIAELPTTLAAVSVLVPAWKEASFLHLTLHELEAVNYPVWEIIIIAGGSDGTYERALQLAKSFHTCPIHVVEQLPNGKNAALNQGLVLTKYEVIVILDGDTLVDPDWLTRLIEALNKTKAAACGNYFPLRRTWVSLLEQMEKISAYEIHNQVILQGSGSIAVRRSVLERLGGFPEDVKVGVDWDLDSRISRLQLPKAFANAAHVRTHRPSTFAQYWKNEVRWRRAHLSALWRQRAVPFELLRGSLHYIVALSVLGGLLFSLLAFFVGAVDIASIFVRLTMLLLLWVVGRHAALIGEVVAYTADTSWLSLLPTTPILLLTSYAASWWAFITRRRQTVHFKGPRT